MSSIRSMDHSNLGCSSQASPSLLGPCSSDHTSGDNVFILLSVESPLFGCSSLAAETLAGWSFHLIPSLIGTNLPAPSHAHHVCPKAQAVHRLCPFIFLYMTLSPPLFKTQIKCQSLCKACPLSIQTWPLFLYSSTMHFY